MQTTQAPASATRNVGSVTGVNEDHFTRDMHVGEGFEGEKNFNKGRCWHEGAFRVEDTVEWKRKWIFGSTQANGFVPPVLLSPRER